MKKEEKIKLLVKYINQMFSSIRGDWADPRSQCREGWEAVSRLKTILGIEQEKEYRHMNDNEDEESYYKRISE